MIQTEVRDPLTDEILFGRLEGGGTVTIAMKDGKLDFKFEASAPPRPGYRIANAFKAAEVPTARAKASAAGRGGGAPRQTEQCQIPTKSTTSPSKSSTAAGGRIPTPRRASSEGAPTSLKPTYVEELEQKVAEKDKQIQEYLTKYRQASCEFEEMRLRLRREISKDIERTRREILSELLEVVDNLERALDAARDRRRPTRSCRASRWSAASS